MRQALILVGGRGTRLGDAARNTPKPLMPIVGDVRFLDYLIENLARHGVEEILLLAGHLADQVVARYDGARVRGATISVVCEPAPAGTAGALRYAADRLDDVFLMLNGDSFFDVNYLALAAALGPDDVGALALRRVEDAGRYGRVETAGGRVEAFREKDAAFTGAALISGGVYILRRALLDRIAKTPCSIETELFPDLAAEGRLAAMESEGYFLDIGLPETLAEGRDALPARLRRGAAFFDRDGTLTRDGGYTHRIEDLVFLPGAIEAVRACNDAGRLAIVVTNQAGVARGLYGEAEVQAFHRAMQAQLNAAGAHIDAFYHCPFHADGAVAAFRFDHPDRKPKPGMLKRALLEWNIDPSRSFLVGDADHDLEAARAAGVSGRKVAPGDLAATVTKALCDPPARSPDEDLVAALKARAARAKRWLFEAALPLWWDVGFDRDARCFHERIALDGTPVLLPRRVRVQARQTFAFAAAGALGWSGPWREAVAAGAAVLMERGLGGDGGTIHALDERGRPADPRKDLYDIAFVAFALAHAAKALGDGACRAAAERLVDWTFETWAHPEGGLFEGAITPAPPRRQNPHMHMLEALLALHEAGGAAGCLERARDIVTLFRTRFVDPRWGALCEYFDESWRPIAGDEGRIAEPGHQFEWSWLIDRYRRLSGDATAMPEAERIHVHGELYGVNAHGFAVDEVWVEGMMRTPSARFWPHTERIKSNIIRVEKARLPAAAAATIEAFDALMTYCDVATPGLWRDRRRPDGTFVEEAAPASSFYHAILALSELIRVGDTL